MCIRDRYEIIMTAFNDVGSSTPSPVALERTRESGNMFNEFINFQIHKNIAFSNEEVTIIFRSN